MGRLVDELRPIIVPAVVGGGTRFFPEGVRVGRDLLHERRFNTGVMLLRYGVRQ